MGVVPRSVALPPPPRLHLALVLPLSDAPTDTLQPAVLPWHTRLYLWLGLGTFALVGLYGGDYFFPETDEEKAARGEIAPDALPALAGQQDGATQGAAAGDGATRERGGVGTAAGKQV